MVDETPPNQGATGDVPPEAAAAAAEGDGPPPTDPGPAAAGPINQGATGVPPWTEDATQTGESPASAASEQDTFSERPELYVGAAFLGGYALAMILRRIGR